MNFLRQEDCLRRLLDSAGLADAVTLQPISGRGFDNEISYALLADGTKVVMRRWLEPREPERLRFRFLEESGLPVPRLLAATDTSSLVEFLDGNLLGDLIERGACTSDVWRLVGDAYRQVHSLRFPARIAGTLAPDGFWLAPSDPVKELQDALLTAEGRLCAIAPEIAKYVPDLQRIVAAASPRLRSRTTSLLHGDINMWNIIVDERRAWLIDWDEACVGASSREVALLDKHSSLFNGTGMDREAFCEGYGRDWLEPDTSIHRVIQTLTWAVSPDWEVLGARDAPAEIRGRVAAWRAELFRYLGDLDSHIQHLYSLL